MRLLATLATRQSSSLRKAEAPNCFTRLTNIVVKTIRKINTVFLATSSHLNARENHSYEGRKGQENVSTIMLQISSKSIL